MYRLLVLGLLLATSLAAQTNPSPEELLRHAVELQQAGDMEGAVQGYRKFLAVQPDEVAAYSNLGVLLAHMGRYDEAATEYNRALELAPGNSGILLNLGLAYYKAGRIPEAAQTFSKAHEIAPDNLQTIMLLGDCQLRMGQNRDVIALLTPVEQANADNLAIAYMMGMALLRDGQVQEGQQRVDKILRNGDSAEARFMLGSQMLVAQDFPAAVKQFAGAIELNPDVPDLQAFYGLALLNTGDPDAAAAAFRKQLASDPNHFEANLYLAQILVARKQWTEAEPLIHQALQVRPDSLPAKLALADLEVGNNQLMKARSTLEAGEKSWPDSYGIHQRLSEVYAALHLPAQVQHEKVVMARLQSKTSSDSGPKTGEQAPDFTVNKMGSEESATLTDLRHTGPVLLVFGSYTCPNFRGAASTLNRLYPEYKNDVPFYLIYIREAHSTQDWASTQNQREGITLQPAKSLDERSDHATMCVRKLHIEFPTLLDTMNGGAEKAYAAWPSKAYLLDTQGRIIFSTGLGEQEFKPEQLEAALAKARTPVKAHQTR
jgi:tetratricopeptide (TPR) repeat protein